ncbi:hypothetical protein Tco_0596484 [Tanacetum coccineum]
MSSPNHSTSNIEDAFSSMNILNYISVSSDYFSASAGSRSFNSSENSNDNMIPPVFSSFYNNTYLKDVQAFHAKELPISSPDPITPPAILTPSLDIKHPKHQPYLRCHRQLIVDPYFSSRKAQTAVIVSASNPNNLTGTPAVKTRNYKEFISLSPSDLNGTEGSVGLFAVERLNQYLTKQMCEENKVKLLLVLYCDALSLVECPCQPYRNRAS